MKNKGIVCLLLFVSVLCDLTCESGQVYIRYYKKNASYASEESVKIYDGDNLLWSSPYFTGQESMGEACIDAATNYQYTIKLIDQYSDGWSSGSHIKIMGLYDNVFFVGTNHDTGTVTFPLSLYTPIMKGSEWKITYSTVSGSWKEFSYSDASWYTATLGAVDFPVSGTQYFRKTFTGVPAMAAYEFSFKYRFGIVAYINGMEIFRDNMPAGEVTPTTSATGSYVISFFHNIIRPGSEVAATSSVLAVELHCAHLPQTFVDFDAFLSIYSPNVEDSDCMAYAADHTVTRQGDTETTKLWDYAWAYPYQQNKANLPVTVDYNLMGPKAYINAISIYAPTNYPRLPSDFKWEGAFTGSAYNTILAINNFSYPAKATYVFAGYFAANVYDAYRLTISSSSDSLMFAYEIVPCICATKYPSGLIYEQAAYTAYANYQTVSIRPTLHEFTNCQISPAPAAGLTFDSNTCTLSGSSTSPIPSTTYTVTSNMNGQSFTGSFSVAFNECANRFVRIIRTYKNNAEKEYFTVFDPVANTTLLSVEKNSGQPSGLDSYFYLCTTATKIEIQVFTTSSYWQAGSYLYLQTMFNHENFETIGRMQRDNNYGYPNWQDFTLEYAVPAHSNWYYKMGEVPANWHNSETAGWVEKPASGYPESTNQIQLYKKTFNVASVEDVAGLVVSLKYQYGVLIYLNGHEVFRKGINGDLSASTMATTTLSSVKYRQISLPVSGSYKGGAFTNFIQAGANTIAIALVASDATMKTSTFDAAVRLMGSEIGYRNFDYTASYSGEPLYNGCANIFDTFYSYRCYLRECADHYVEITFDNDRREWISSIALKLYYTQDDETPRSFVLKAKNPEDEEWTVIKSYSGLTWSQNGQRNRYWTFSGQAYNMYRIDNIVGTEQPCRWEFGSIEFIRDSYPTEIPALSYEDVTIYRFIEMAEVYANSDYYADFTVTPPLPVGINLDFNTGMISGKTSASLGSQVYTISAKKYTGEVVHTSFTFAIDVCSNGQSLITLVIRTDNFANEHMYWLYKGKGVDGELLHHQNGLPVKNALNYADFCLADDIYTFQMKDKYSDGWSDPAGFYVSVDEGEMKFISSRVWTPSVHSELPTYSFSSFMPFQAEYADWKVLKNSDEIENWNAIDFDDSTWTVTKAADIGTDDSITTYVRKEFNLESVGNYTLLNVRVKYTGGVVAYFNGRKVARFNLEDQFQSNSESKVALSTPLFSKFHIILETSGVVAGKNVMAFEVHRPLATSSAIPVVFDASGIFDVNDCAFALDSYSIITGTEMASGSGIDAFFDMNPTTGSSLVNAVGTYIEWIVDNLEGSRFNKFGIGSADDVNGLGFSLYGRDDALEPQHTLVEALNAEMKTNFMYQFDTPVGIAGYNQYRFEIDVAGNSNPYFYDIFTLYCRAQGEGICPGIDEYPPVGEGQISPGECEYGYYGYTYRECHEGVLGEIKTEHCQMKVPADIQYDREVYTLVYDTNIRIAPPKYLNIINRFYLAPNVKLPKGLSLDETTGAITGMPAGPMELTAYTIYGENEVGAAETVISIMIRMGECRAEGNFQKVSIGETSTFDCSTMGSYIGTLSRSCALGAKDGEWQKASGMCMSYTLLTVIIVVVVLLLLVLVLVLVKNKKVKAVSAVKGKQVVKKTEKKAKV